MMKKLRDYKKYEESLKTSIEKDGNDNKINFKDFIALYLASFMTIVPVLILAFALFSGCVFLLFKFWLK